MRIIVRFPPNLVNPDVGFRHIMVETDVGIRHTMANSDIRAAVGSMKRTAMAQLVAWLQDPKRKPLVVNGARQVGKTWLVCAFAREHVGNIAHIVFLDNEEAKHAFEGSLDANRLLMLIGAMTGTNPADGKTLVFLDEIQECPRAITVLKLFCEQRPDIPVVAAGSLLGVALNRMRSDDESPASWPVGKVAYLNLNPLSFEEYVDAVGGEQLSAILASRDTLMIDALSERFSDLLRTYLFVGGMPEVVQQYVETGDFSRVRGLQNDLLNGYEHDFSKHVSSPVDIERIRQTWRSVPIQLARETDMRRFTYASIRVGARGRDYRDAVSWLVDAGLVTKVPRVSKPGIPLAAYEDGSYFKLYYLDVGLLGAACNIPARAIAEGNRLFTEYKGAFAEQYVCQQMIAAGGIAPRYWSADGKQKKGEVDFIIEHDGEVFPVEVKAEENVAGGSISAFVKRYGISRAIRLSMLPAKDQGWLLNLPLYAACGMLDLCAGFPTASREEGAFARAMAKKHVQPLS